MAIRISSENRHIVQKEERIVSPFFSGRSVHFSIHKVKAAAKDVDGEKAGKTAGVAERVEGAVLSATGVGTAAGVALIQITRNI